MSKAAAGQEIILTVGILIAVGIALVQLRGIFIGETRAAQAEIVYSFARDLESVVDRAIANTGDAVFVYTPPIKKYTVDISNNVVNILDKLSNKSVAFTKSSKLAPNKFEDSDQIFVEKKESEIFILGQCSGEGAKCYNSLGCCKDSPYCTGKQDAYACKKECAKNGDAALDKISCCSGYLNEATGVCDNPPLCSKENICLGAPDVGNGGDSWIDSEGQTCCPLLNSAESGPVCSYMHCCPADKPKWCDMPIQGSSRCMTEQDYKDQTKCKSEKWRLAYVPLNFDSSSSDESAYVDFASTAFDFWMKQSPFRDCPSGGYDRIDMRIIKPSDDSSCVINCGGSCSLSGSCPACDSCVTAAIKCANAVLGSGNWDKLVGISKTLWPLAEGGYVCGCGMWDWSSCTDGPSSSTWYQSDCSMQAPGQANPPGIVAHELGHTLRLCHECGVGRPTECPNPEVSDVNYMMCYGTNQYFSPGSYNYLKGSTVGYCNEKSSIAKFLEGC